MNGMVSLIQENFLAKLSRMGYPILKWIAYKIVIAYFYTDLFF